MREGREELQAIRNDLAIVALTLEVCELSRVPPELACLVGRAHVRLFQALERLEALACAGASDAVQVLDQVVEAERLVKHGDTARH